ncbi:hypothetical protein [Risungbinella massiliensis]|uniref:hypothetical protein n=1 Tax=Risungbinella massiliensis TaxID=1329796 RepID=UPI0005CC6728|nr:hypothetical protein [Risungbinella massiliensis]
MQKLTPLTVAILTAFPVFGALLYLLLAELTPQSKGISLVLLVLFGPMFLYAVGNYLKEKYSS